MSFSLRTRLKRISTFGVVFFVALGSMLGTISVFYPQKAHAILNPATDFNYGYIVQDGLLHVYAYVKGDSDRAIGWRAFNQDTPTSTCDFNPFFFNATEINSHDDEGVGVPANDGVSDLVRVNTADDMLNITVSGCGANGVLVNPGGQNAQITIRNPERAEAFYGCLGGGNTRAETQTCVEEDPEVVAANLAGPPEESPATCESEGGSLSWIICPTLFLGDAVLRKLDQAIIGLLSIPNDYYTNPDLERAWGRIRNLAYLVLVPIMLVMVIGTALGFDFVSAYTVKRALPRLVIAAIFIALSFEITKFLVILTNDVGKGIGGLVIGAFSGAETISLASLFSPNAGDGNVIPDGAVALPLFLVAGAGGIVIGGLGVILSFVLVAIVGLAIGFFLLSFRQMLVIALMLVAPLAILAWIFPGNDKLWKLWWGTFSKLLLLFPLIMLLTSVGKVFALLVRDTDGSIVSTLMKLVAYVGPYFLIPATFKFAGGVFATISGMTNDRQKGFFDKQRKKRAETYAKNRELAGRNARWNPNTRAGKWFNSSASWVTDPVSNAKIAAGTKGGESIMNRVNQAKMEHTQKLAQQMGQVGFNDKALESISLGAIARNKDGQMLDSQGNVVSDASKAHRIKYDGSKKSMDNIVANMQRSKDSNDQLGAKQLEDNGAFLRDIYDNEDTGRASVQGAAGLALASQGFADSEGMARLANDLDGKDSRFKGMGSMYKTQAELLNNKAGGLTKPGYSVVLDKDTGEWRAAAGVKGNHGANIERIQSISVGDLSQAKGGAIDKLAPTYQHILTSEVGTEYTKMNGEKDVITQSMKDAVLHTLTMASRSYNNPDVAAKTDNILRESLPPQQYAQTRRGGGMNEDEYRRTLPGPGEMGPGEGESHL